MEPSAESKDEKNFEMILNAVNNQIWRYEAGNETYEWKRSLDRIVSEYERLPDSLRKKVEGDYISVKEGVELIIETDYNAHLFKKRR